MEDGCLYTDYEGPMGPIETHKYMSSQVVRLIRLLLASKPPTMFLDLLLSHIELLYLFFFFFLILPGPEERAGILVGVTIIYELHPGTRGDASRKLSLAHQRNS